VVLFWHAVAGVHMLSLSFI